MGNQTIRVIPEHMDTDKAQWSAAAQALGSAHEAVPPMGITFGSFESIVGTKFKGADLAVQNNLETGQSRLAAVSSNIASNYTQTRNDDVESSQNVGNAGQGGGGGGGGGGTSGGGGGQNGGGPDKGLDHYTDVLGGRPIDPKDPEVTFDRHVDPETGDVTWTERDMRPGEGDAKDGRDVERIPPRADRVVVTLVDGEPRLTFVDRPELGAAGMPTVAAGPRPETALGQQWSQPLPDGADHAVIEVRDGEPHLVFLETDGKAVSQISEVNLRTGETTPTTAALPLSDADQNVEA